jgi:hypothetical protein
MHEVDTQPEPRLTEALRRLAASSPQSAPPEIGAAVLNEFRRHHARRRRIRQTGVAALVASLALAAALVFMRQPANTHPQTASTPKARPAGETANAEAGKAEAPVVKTPVQAAAAVSPARRPTVKQAAARPAARPSSRAAGRAFLALPGYDPAVPLDELNVVRVRLPESALWKMGAPVTADAGTRRVTADFVVSQDGTPYAVRLVQ